MLRLANENGVFVHSFSGGQRKTTTLSTFFQAAKGKRRLFLYGLGG
jgi:hypothetical protein